MRPGTEVHVYEDMTNTTTGSFEVGDEVYGCVGGFKGTPGVLAEYALADSRLLAPKPPPLTMREAAAIPLIGITAWNALIDRGELTKGQRVLIHAGTGGVGHIALQLAKAMGAEVHTTISTKHKADLAQHLGADRVINYSQTSPKQYVQEFTNGFGYDLVFDTVGGTCLDHSFEAAKEYGTVVSIAARANHDLSQVHVKSLSLHVVFINLIDAKFESIDITDCAPLEINSNEIFPVPVNKSRTSKPSMSIECSSTLNKPSLAKSVVGRE